ncbi:MAG: protein-disulfide reductase DsbD domain-containing protein [Pseudomonadota bacterium]
MLRFFLAFVLFLTPATAQTGSWVTTGHAESRLIAEKTAAVPGETLWVALDQQLEEGWHVYWKNPGDSGLPLELSWTLPEGFEAGEIGYPLPHRLPLGPLMNFGHEGRPLFLVPITVPADTPAGRSVRFDVFAEWLICLDVCIPESADLSLAIAVADEAADASGNAAMIREARSALPRELNLNAAFADRDGEIVLAIEGAPAGEAYIFPSESGYIEPAAPQPSFRSAEDLIFTLTPALKYRAAPPETLSGVMVVSMDGQEVGVVFNAQRSDEVLALASSAAAARDEGAGNIFLIFAFALLGGLVLNAMPCVFPIVFLKAAGIAQLAGADRSEVKKDAFAYTGGVLVTFVAMASLLLVLRGLGAELGWGFHLQSPIAVGLFAVIVFLIGLNLAGVFEVGTSIQGAGQGLTQKKGAAGSFFTGLLAVLVAAPCIGPFLGLPIGYALTAPPAAAIAIFLALGLGLALPYLALAAAPQIASLLPKPGAWMVRLKQLFSFAMFGTVVWLTWVLSLQAGPQGVLILGIAFVASSLAAWLFGLAQENGNSVALLAAAAAAIGAALIPLFTLTAQPVAVASASTEKIPYDEAMLAQYRAEGTPVFIDFTAAWCVTCQYNKRVVLDTEPVKSLFQKTGTVFMVADLTNPDPIITAAIERQGRSGVPLYLYYNGEAEPEILPQILTVERVAQTLEQAG